MGATAKWAAFAEADAAIAASGTVILELALCGIPTVSTYKADFLIRMMHKRIRIWSANLPSLIADYPVVPEYFNESVRPGALARWLERLSADTAERRTMLEGYQRVWEIMSTDIAPGEKPPRSFSAAAPAKAGSRHRDKQKGRVKTRPFVNPVRSRQFIRGRLDCLDYLAASLLKP